jgi:hypothetical protein
VNKGNRRDGSHQEMPRPFPRSAPPPQTDDQTSAENRRKLEALFSSGGVASLAQSAQAAAARQSSLRERSETRVRRTVGRPISPYKLRFETLRNAREPEEIERAADAFLKEHQYPGDMSILLKLLLHPAEKVQRGAMGEIHSLLVQGRVEHTLVLSDRLKDLAARDLEPDTRLFVEGLQHQIKATPQRKGLLHQVAAAGKDD